MGCFFACFTNSKHHRKSPHLQDKVSSGNQSQEPQPTKPIKQDSIHNPSNLTESKYDPEELLSNNSIKKKVTFDLNVKTHKELSSEETQCCLVESKIENKEETQNESETLLGSNVSSMAIESHDPPNHRYHNCTSSSDDECVDMDLEESDHSDGPTQEEESSESLFSISIGKFSSAAEMGSKEVNSPLTIRDSPREGMNSIGSSRSARKKTSVAEMGSDEVNSPIKIHDSPDEGMNSVGLNRSARKKPSAAEMGSLEVNSPIKIRDSPHEGMNSVGLNQSARKKASAAEMGSHEVNCLITICDSPHEELNSVGLNQIARNKSQQHVLGVLSPVENLTQWKLVKAKTSPPLEHLDKENIADIEHEEPNFKLQFHTSKGHFMKSKTEDGEISVDTSLSSWLVDSEMVQPAQTSLKSTGNSSPERANSAASFEDRPILGAMTVEELRKLSEFSSPRRSPRRASPDEIPIIGTVGSYWSHTGHTVDWDTSSSSSSRVVSYASNKYTEEKRGKSRATPFEKRLERAVDSGIAQV